MKALLVAAAFMVATSAEAQRGYYFYPSGEIRFPEYSEMASTALFGSQDTELLGLDQFLKTINESVSARDFPQIAKETKDEANASLTTIGHWNGEKYIKRKIYVQLDFGEENYVLSFNEGGTKTSETYSAIFIYRRNKTNTNGEVILTYNPTGFYSCKFIIPVEFEKPYTWAMFDHGDIAPKVKRINSEDVKMIATEFGADKETKVHTDREFEMRELLDMTGHVYAEIVNAYIEAE